MEHGLGILLPHDLIDFRFEIVVGGVHCLQQHEIDDYIHGLRAGVEGAVDGESWVSEMTKT